MYDTYMSTPGNTVKLRAMHTLHSNIQIAQTVPGWDQTYNALVSTSLSKHSNPLCQPGIKPLTSDMMNYSDEIMLNLMNLLLTVHKQ